MAHNEMTRMEIIELIDRFINDSSREFDNSKSKRAQIARAAQCAILKQLKCAITFRENATQTVHPSITSERVMEAVERNNTSLDKPIAVWDPGFCLACGEEAEGCEPDARRYECEACGKSAVYGAEELLLRLC